MPPLAGRISGRRRDALLRQQQAISSVLRARQQPVPDSRFISMHMQNRRFLAAAGHANLTGFRDR
jgi:hypothetical protein